MATLKYKTKDGEYKPLTIMSPSSKIERFEKDEDGNIVLEQGDNVFTIENSDVYFSDMLTPSQIDDILNGEPVNVDINIVKDLISKAAEKIIVFSDGFTSYIANNLYTFSSDNSVAFMFDFCGINGNDGTFIRRIYYQPDEQCFKVDNTIGLAVENLQPKLESGTNIKTINGESILGEGNLNITAASLEIDTVLKYHGVTTTFLTDGAIINPIVINGSNHTAASGCVVFYGNKEFVFDGTTWKELGDGSNHKIKQDAVNSPSASGTTTAFIDTISQDANGKITATKKNITSASTSTAGIVQLSSSTSSTSTTTAATASAVKSAYDRASTALTTANGKWTYNASTIAGVKVNNAGYADSAGVATGVSDYGSTSLTILIGYEGAGLTSSTCSHLAGYTDGGKKIKDISANEVKAWLGLGSNAYNSTTIPTNTNQLTNGAGFITSYTDTKVNNTASASGDRFLLGISSNTSGTVTATGTNSSVKMNGGYLYALSDETLKNFEDDVQIDFEELKTLPKKYFRWKDNPETLNIGTSAQSVQKLYPELVSKGDDGKLSVNYIHLSVVALAAIDKLHEENLELKERIEKLEKLLNVE